MTTQMKVQQPKEPKFRNKGIIRAAYVPALVGIPAGVISCNALEFMKKTSTISKADSVELSKAVQEGLKQTGLYDKGVRVYKIKENPVLSNAIKSYKEFLSSLFEGKADMESLEDFSEIFKNIFKYDKKDKKALGAITEELKSNKKVARLEKILGQNIAEESAKFQALMFKEGSNACYLPHANKIITPDKTLQTSVFHEIGHALNNNGGIILKGLQKCRPLAKTIPSVVLLISLFNKRKTTDKPQENDSKIQKGADFVKKNAGIIAGLSFLPMVLEEGIASLRGQKVAKNLVKDNILSKDLFKKIKLTNLGGFSTYALAAVIAGIGTHLAIKVKDNIQAKYEEKKMQKFKAQMPENKLYSYQG